MEPLSLYEKLGGRDTVTKVVDVFYEKVLNDETVNSFFIDVDMKKQRSHQVKFISFALGGPNKYSGKSMAKAHEGLNLLPIHFEAITNHLKSTLTQFGVAEKDLNVIIDNINSLKDDILYK